MFENGMNTPIIEGENYDRSFCSHIQMSWFIVYWCHRLLMSNFFKKTCPHVCVKYEKNTEVEIVFVVLNCRLFWREMKEGGWGQTSPKALSWRLPNWLLSSLLFLLRQTHNWLKSKWKQPQSACWRKYKKFINGPRRIILQCVIYGTISLHSLKKRYQWYLRWPNGPIECLMISVLLAPQVL